MFTLPEALFPAKSRLMAAIAFFTFRLRVISVPFSSDATWTMEPLGVSMVSVAVHEPPSSAMVEDTFSGICWPLTSIMALYLKVPGCRSTAGFGAPTELASTFFGQHHGL